jgi:hypothetical protein
VIGAATCRLIGNLFRLHELGSHAVRGLSEPIEAWAAEEMSASEGRFEAVRSSRLTAFLSAASTNWACCSSTGTRCRTA